jgi:hypothetical protein
MQENIYELITPSDPITFKANDNKIAFFCAVLLGNGKAGCDNKTTDESLPTMIMFSQNPDKDIADYIGCDLTKYVKANKLSIAKCFKSFAYGSVSDRETYDNACEAITNAKKLKEFKAKHEDKNRSSMSQWVKSAWQYGEQFSK